MKKLIALMLVASFTGAVIAQQSAPQQTAPAAKANQAGPAKGAPMSDKDKKHHRHHHRHHHIKADAAK